MKEKGRNQVEREEPTLTPTEQKIWDYLKEHKTPITAGTLAKRFIISQSKSYHTLAMLERNGLAVSFNVGTTKFYKRKDS
jgi:uncharacterized membrane protein